MWDGFIVVMKIAVLLRFRCFFFRFSLYCAVRNFPEGYRMHYYRNFFLAMRPWSFTMSFFSVSVGSALAALDGAFFWPLYLMAVVGMIGLHGAANLYNDYFDVRSGVDAADAATAQYRPHPLVEGRLDAGQVLALAIAMNILGAGLGIWLAVTRGLAILAIGMAGVVTVIFYTAPPFQFKYRSMGEFFVFLMWGPLAFEGAYYVQRQAFSINALLVSIPFGMLVALVLLANNLRDRANDARHGIRTVAISLGEKHGGRLFIALIVLAFAAVPAMIATGVLGPWSLIVLLAAPLAVRLSNSIAHTAPIDADARTAQLDTAFGMLLLLSLVLERLL